MVDKLSFENIDSYWSKIDGQQYGSISTDHSKNANKVTLTGVWVNLYVHMDTQVYNKLQLLANFLNTNFDIMPASDKTDQTVAYVFFDLTGQQTNQVTETNVIMDTLALLGPMYIGRSGFYNDNNYVLPRALSVLHDLKTQQLVDIYFNNQTIDHVEDCEDDGYHFIYDIDTLFRLSQQTVPFDKVTIKYLDDTWFGDLKKWYNRTSQNQKDLPPMKSRKEYIKIVEPFMEVTICAARKGRAITLEDILFATRGLMVDKTRNIDGGYKLLSQKNNHLVIEPDVDNYFT